MKPAAITKLNQRKIQTSEMTLVHPNSTDNDEESLSDGKVAVILLHVGTDNEGVIERLLQSVRMKIM
jgi:translation initiation factor 6 (eIF-6)